MKTEYLSKDNNWQNGTTTYWFDVTFDVLRDSWDAEKMILGVVESGSDEPIIVDDESYPIEGDWFECYVCDLPEYVTDEMRQE